MKSVNVRLDDDLHARLKAAAERDHRSLQQQITWLLDTSVDAAGAFKAIREDPERYIGPAYDYLRRVTDQEENST